MSTQPTVHSSFAERLVITDQNTKEKPPTPTLQAGNAHAFRSFQLGGTFPGLRRSCANIVSVASFSHGDYAGVSAYSYESV